MKKDGKAANKCVYSVLGIDMDGMKDILGVWIGEAESAPFWATIFNELRNRGVEDIIIACHGNLTGFGNALASVFPKTVSQLCIIHMARNSTNHFPYKDLRPLMADLKKVYGAASEEEALYALDGFNEKWGSQYPQIYKMWEENWDGLSEFFKYPNEVRSIIYTTNAVEGFHRMLRKLTKTKTNFPTDGSLKKSICLPVKEISKKWTMPIKNWGVVIGQMMIYHEERIKGAAAVWQAQTGGGCIQARGMGIMCLEKTMEAYAFHPCRQGSLPRQGQDTAPSEGTVPSPRPREPPPQREPSPRLGQGHRPCQGTSPPRSRALTRFGTHSQRFKLHIAAFPEKTIL